MRLQYDLEKLECAMYDFNRATNVSITLFDTDMHPITHRGIGSGRYCALIATTDGGRHNCNRSNRKLLDECRKKKALVRHICGAGLLDIAIPLLHRDNVMGFLMLGQIRMNEKLPETALSLSADRRILEEYYASLPIYTDDTVKSVINVASMLTRYIMLENIVKPMKKDSASLIADFVEKNLSTRLSAQTVASSLGLSVSGVYKAMHGAFGTTLGEYVKERRIARAVALLDEGELSVEEVSYAVGFSDAAYFSRCFKAKMGRSPIKYKKEKI
jgi:AraC-like DNA-binding protein